MESTKKKVRLHEARVQGSDDDDDHTAGGGGAPAATDSATGAQLPRKRFYRQRAHSNPLADHTFDTCVRHTLHSLSRHSRAIE
jgi:hypothetical protein